MLLFIRTDSEAAEVGLTEESVIVRHIKWNAGRNLSQDIHRKIKEILNKEDLNWDDLEEIAFYEGPGSFTGLRIGATVANALASELDVPISQDSGKNWVKKGRQKNKQNPQNRFVIPNYGREPHITKPRK